MSSCTEGRVPKEMSRRFPVWGEQNSCRGLNTSLTPNPPLEGVALASCRGKKVLLCFWDNALVAKKLVPEKSFPQ